MWGRLCFPARRMTPPRRTPSPVRITTTPPWPWSFTDRRGREHAARDLSPAELLKWRARFAWASHMGPWHLERMRSRLIRHLFPFRLTYLWHGDPVARLFTLPVAEQCAAFAELFRRAGIEPPAFTPSGPQP